MSETSKCPDCRARELGLTSREIEVVRAVARDLSASYQAIANCLGISYHTVHSHISNIAKKLDANSKEESVFVCLRKGILTMQDCEENP